MIVALVLYNIPYWILCESILYDINSSKNVYDYLMLMLLILIIIKAQGTNIHQKNNFIENKGMQLCSNYNQNTHTLPPIFFLQIFEDEVYPLNSESSHILCVVMKIVVRHLIIKQAILDVINKIKGWEGKAKRSVLFCVNAMNPLIW